ncbi:hypothetical protein HaLaN_24649, partial [Haematococcus lacustris]
MDCRRRQMVGEHAIASRGRSPTPAFQHARFLSYTLIRGCEDGVRRFDSPSMGEAQRKLAAGQRLGQGHDLDLHLLGGWVPGGGRQRAAAATAAGGEGWGQGSWSAPAPCLAPGGHQFSLQT